MADEIGRLSEAQKAVRLLYKGLSPRASALRGDQEYGQLIAHYRADPAFRSLVHELAPMLELRVLDVLEQAIVLAPTSPESTFAATISDIRSSLREMERATLALIQIAIAATFFPTAAVLAGRQDDDGEVSASAEQIVALLKDHCQRLEETKRSDPELGEAGLIEAWRELLRLPETQPDSQRAAMSSLLGRVKLVLNQLQTHGMVNALETETGESYVPTPRYRLQVRELASHAVFERCIEVLPGFADRES